MATNANGGHGNGHAGAEATATAAKPEPKILNIRCAGQDGTDLKFKMKDTTRFAVMMEAYAGEKKMAIGSLRFLFDGNRVSCNETPQMLDMEDGDVIDVVVEQVGGSDSHDESQAPVAPGAAPLSALGVPRQKGERPCKHAIQARIQGWRDTSERRLSLLAQLRERVKRDPSLLDKYAELLIAREGLEYDARTRAIQCVWSDVPVSDLEDEPGMRPYANAIEASLRHVGLYDRYGYLMPMPTQLTPMRKVYIERLRPFNAYMRGRTEAEQLFVRQYLAALANESRDQELRRSNPTGYAIMVRSAMMQTKTVIEQRQVAWAGEMLEQLDHAVEAGEIARENEAPASALT